jgi:hypothetical protein
VLSLMANPFDETIEMRRSRRGKRLDAVGWALFFIWIGVVLLVKSLPHGLGALGLGFSYNSSDQNGYDASAVRYTPYFYNYGEWSLTPSLTFLAGPQGPGTRPMVLELSGSWWRRRYPYRTAQDAAGAYSNGALHTAGWSFGAALSYPMLRRLSLILDAKVSRNSSNQDFEQFYRYNYSAANFLFGVRYEY